MAWYGQRLWESHGRARDARVPSRKPRLAGHIGGRGIRGREALAREPGEERRAGSPGSSYPANLFGAGKLGVGSAMIHRGNFEAREH